MIFAAAVSDLNGRWATGSPIVSTQGSTNVDCLGLVSTSHGPTTPAQNAQPTPAPAPWLSRARIGAICAAAAALLIACGVIAWAVRRRRRTAMDADSDAGSRHSEIAPYTVEAYTAGYYGASRDSKTAGSKPGSPERPPVPLLTVSSYPDSRARIRELPPPYAFPAP
jgi:hypothetical protein